MISSVENTQPPAVNPQQRRWQRSDGMRDGENTEANRETFCEQPEELQNGGQNNGENRLPPQFSNNSFNNSNQRNLNQMVNVPTLYYGAYMKQWVFNLRCFAASIGYEMKTVFYLPKCINNALHQNVFMDGVSLFYNPQIHDHLPGWPLNTAPIQPTKFLPVQQVNAELPMAYLKDMYNNMHSNVATLHRITNPWHARSTNDLQLVIYWRAAQFYDELVQYTRNIGLARNCQEFAKMDDPENVKKPVIFYHRLFPIMVADELPYIPPPTPDFFANQFLPSLGLNNRRPRMQSYVPPSQMQNFAMQQQYQPIPQPIPELGNQQFPQHLSLTPNHRFVPTQIQPGPIPPQVQEFAPQQHHQAPHNMNFVPQSQGQPQIPEFVSRNHQNVQGNNFVQQQLPCQPNEEHGQRKTSPYNNGSRSGSPPQYPPQQEFDKVPPVTQYQQSYPHSHPKFVNHNYYQGGHAHSQYSQYGQFNPSNEQAYNDENVAPNQHIPQFLPNCQYPPNVLPQHPSFPISQSPQNASSLGNSPPLGYSSPPNPQIPRLNQVQHGQLYYQPEQYQQPLCQAMEQVRV